ncbi:hypothetical protein BDV96DRAFT_612972 [Lophiotrema nucula]|uniref:Uncharacterized protein n=1 Tax=Lophiotrema nucula TaxID=690887 RepID=A0A6A5Z9A8_9PLEO|nr:hypothetical protein BDV96DRAFT_612972 [Lophiotrema nucula]
MSTFAPPVRRGDFLYSSLLYADIGNGNQHPRASVAELTNLLRPQQVPTAKKRKNVLSAASEPPAQDFSPAKDQVGHFYTAQLVHYGLPQTKDKNTAKVRLLDALNQGKLEVPAWITKLEGELRKEWEAENRKLKKGAKVVGGIRGSGGGSGGRRSSDIPTSSSGAANNITVNVSLNSPFMIDPQTLAQATPTSTSSRKPTAKKRKIEHSPEPTRSTTPKKARPSQPQPISSSKLTKEELSARAKSSPAPRVKKEPSQPSSSRATPKSSQKIKTEPRIKHESGHVDTPGFAPRSSKKIKAEPPDDDQPGPILLSGTYDVTCPAVEERFPHLDCSDLQLSLLKDDDRGVWWASFSWAAWDCLIQMNPGPSYTPLGEPCSLGWRLKDNETGELRFGRNCTGDMTFFNNQSFHGLLYKVPFVGTVEFWGVRVFGIGEVGKGGDDFQWEWDAFVKEAYGR